MAHNPRTRKLVKGLKAEDPAAPPEGPFSYTPADPAQDPQMPAPEDSDTQVSQAVLMAQTAEPPRDPEWPPGQPPVETTGAGYNKPKTKALPWWLT